MYREILQYLKCLIFKLKRCVFPCRFISLNMNMDETNFVWMHRGVIDAVISKGAFKEIIGKLKLSSFARKQVHHEAEELPEQREAIPHDPQPSTSQDFGGAKPKVKRRRIGKGRGKTTDKTSEQSEIVVGPTTLEKVDTMTQTDSDFEEYLQLSEEQFEQYQLYKEMQVMQQYSVQTIQEEDFREYDGK